MKPFKRDTSHSVEVTKEAAWLLIGNSEKSWIDYENTELAEMSVYHAHGVTVFIIHNYVAETTQYYIQDINA